MTKDEFYVKWLQCFASDLSSSDLEKYVVSTGNLVWHIFSWGLRDKDTYLTGNAARTAYDRADKCGAMYINWFEDGYTGTVDYSLNTAKALDDFVEIYVVARDFSWTYIKTHENMCGPYFMEV